MNDKQTAEIIATYYNACQCAMRDTMVQISLGDLKALLDSSRSVTKEIVSEPVLEKADEEWMDAPLGPPKPKPGVVTEVAIIQPPPKRVYTRHELKGTTQQGAFAALVADGVTPKAAAEEVGAEMRWARGWCGQFRANIEALRLLPPGDARYAYLQKWFRWGEKK